MLLHDLWLLLDWSGLLDWWTHLLWFLGGGNHHLLLIEWLHHLGSTLQLTVTEAGGIFTELSVAAVLLGKGTSHLGNLFLVSDMVLPVDVEPLFLQHSLLVE